MSNTLLQVEDLRTYFMTRRGVVKAVDGISFSVDRGQTLGIVGESGSGKSITAMSILRLLPQPAGKIVSGSIKLDGDDLVKKSQKQMRKIRGKKVAIILQDPMTSLDPAFTVGNQIMEAVQLHQKAQSSRARWEKVVEALKLVRIPDPWSRLKQYPHQMSGGMRQRVTGAIALSCQPLLLIADEPTTSLDVTIQAQYLKLLRQVREESNVGMIFITHDLGIVAKMCDHVAVMYAGKIVEAADTVELFRHPTHPYTIGLLSCIPKTEVRVAKLFCIEGQPPTLENLPPGCKFAPRCMRAEERCRQEYPPEKTIGPNHIASCWFI